MLLNFTLQVDAGAVLARCGKLRSLCALGERFQLQLASLRQITRLSLSGAASGLGGVAQLTQLQQLQLVPYAVKQRALLHLWGEVSNLPQLRVLALPGKLLCEKCCSGIREGSGGLGCCVLQPQLQTGAVERGEGTAAAARAALNQPLLVPAWSKH